MNALQSHLEEVQKQNTAALEQQEAAYNRQLKKQLEALKQNFSIAAEFAESAEQTLQSKNESLHNAEDVAILDELKQRETNLSQQLAHDRAINSISPEGASVMLEQHSRSTHPARHAV